jgi:hypothetical protein
MIRTWESYKTESALEGYDILGRILDSLVDSPDCNYQTRQWTKEQYANWEARVLIVGLRFSFDHVQAVLSAPETRDEVTTDEYVEAEAQTVQQVTGTQSKLFF